MNKKIHVLIGLEQSPLLDALDDESILSIVGKTIVFNKTAQIRPKQFTIYCNSQVLDFYCNSLAEPIDEKLAAIIHQAPKGTTIN